MEGMAPPLARPPKTVEDYMALPEDVRAELIQGELLMTPGPSSRHQDVAGQIYRLLSTYAETRDGDLTFVAPLDVHLPSGDVVQPDVVYVRATNREILDRWIHGVPDLLVEVVSPTHPERDRMVKRRLYERCAVPEYWIADPADRTVEVLSLEGGAYAPRGYFTAPAVLRSPLLPDFELPLAEVFRAL